MSYGELRNVTERPFTARPKSQAERWAYLVSEARRIIAFPMQYTASEVRWAEDVETAARMDFRGRLSGVGVNNVR